MHFIKRLARRTDGQDLIEYALLASLLSVTVVVVLSSLGPRLSSSFDKIDTALSAPAAPGNGGGNNGGGNNGGGNNGGGNNGGGNNGGGNNGGGNNGGGNNGGGGGRGGGG